MTNESFGHHRPREVVAWLQLLAMLVFMVLISLAMALGFWLAPLDTEQPKPMPTKPTQQAETP